MSSDSDCIFCKIAAKQIPALIVDEGEAWVAFLDVNPLAPGHLLVIPRTHHELLVDVPAKTFTQLAVAIPRLGRALLEVSGAEGFNLLQNNGGVAGQVVPHVHFHLIPRLNDDGLGYRWNAGSYPPGRDTEVAKKYRSMLSGSD